MTGMIRPKTRRLSIVIVILLTLALTACGSGDNVDASLLILQDSNIRWNGSECTGAGGLSEIREGTTVTVYLSDVVKTSELHEGSRTPEDNCRFTFDLSGVTEGRAEFRVGSLPRVQGVITDNGRETLWVTIGYD